MDLVHCSSMINNEWCKIFLISSFFSGNRPVPSAIARRQEQAVDAKIFAETPSAGSSALWLRMKYE